MYIDEQYWSQNFNYMDHNMWYLLLNEENKVKKEEYFSSINRQLNLKINSINYIRNSLQRRYRRRFAIESETIETTSFLNNNIPQDFNLISKTWYLFSKLKAINNE